MKTIDDKFKDKQKQFENSIKVLPLEELEEVQLYSEDNYEKVLEPRKYLDNLLNTIPERWRTVLEMKYYENRSLKEIANILNVTYAHIRETEKRALIRLSQKTRRISQKKIQDGEILLAYILSKSSDYDSPRKNKIKKIMDFINRNYHERDYSRNESSINRILYQPKYKSQLQKLRQQYFPLSTK